MGSAKCSCPVLNEARRPEMAVIDGLLDIMDQLFYKIGKDCDMSCVVIDLQKK